LEEGKERLNHELGYFHCKGRYNLLSRLAREDGTIMAVIKSARFEMRLDPSKLAQYKEAARKEGISLSSWIEKAADKTLKERKDMKKILPLLLVLVSMSIAISTPVSLSAQWVPTPETVCTWSKWPLVIHEFHSEHNDHENRCTNYGIGDDGQILTGGAGECAVDPLGPREGSVRCTDVVGGYSCSIDGVMRCGQASFPFHVACVGTIAHPPEANLVFSTSDNSAFCLGSDGRMDNAFCVGGSLRVEHCNAQGICTK
jgi:hypothetical protein